MKDNKNILDTSKTEMGSKAYFKYVNRLYRKITTMHSGEKFDIDDIVSVETKPLFMELLKNFILMHPGEYLFSNDYNQFIKQHADRLETARKIREKMDREAADERDSQEIRSN